MFRRELIPLLLPPLVLPSDGVWAFHPVLAPDGGGDNPDICKKEEKKLIDAVKQSLRLQLVALAVGSRRPLK